MAQSRVLKIVIAGDGKGAESAFDAVAGKASSFGRKIAALGGGISVAFATKKVYEFGSSLEQNLNILEQLSVENGQVTRTAQQFNAALAAQAGQITRLGYSTGEASGALVELVKAGLSADEATKSLTSTLVLARGGGLELADSATAISNSLNVFRGTGLDAAGAANILANAANISSANAGNLLESLQQAGAVASQAGLDFAETSAILALLANNGIKGSDAGTSLKTMLNRLRVPVEGSTEAMKKLGVSVFDSRGKIRKITDVIADLDKATSKLSDKDKAQAFYKIFGSDAIRSGTIATREGAQTLSDFIERVKQAGTAQAVAESRTKGFSGAMKQIGAGVKTGAEQLYMTLAPSLATIAQSFLTVGTAAGSGMMKELKAALPSIQAWAKSASGAMDSFFRGFANGTGAGGKTREILTQLGGVIMNVGRAAWDAAQLVWEFVKPFIPLVALIGGVLLATLSGAASALASFAGWLKGTSAGATALKAALVTLIGALVGLKAAMAIGWVVSFISTLVTLSRTVGILRTVIVNLRVAMFLLNAAMAANPIGVIIVAVIALGALLVYLYRRFDTVRTVINAVGTVAKRVLAGIGAIIMGIITAAVKLVQGVTKLVLGSYDMLLKGAAKAFGWIPGIGDKLKSARDAFSSFASDVNGKLATVANGAENVATALSDVAQDRHAKITIEYQTVYTGDGRHDSVGEREDERKQQRDARTRAGRPTGASAYVPTVPKPKMPKFGSNINPISSFGDGGGGGSKAKSKAQTAAQKAAKQAQAFSENVGKWLVKGYLDGYTRSRGALEKASLAIKQSINKLEYVPAANKSRALAILASNTARLKTLVDKRIDLTKKLKTAESQLSGLKAGRQSLFEAVRDKLFGNANLGSTLVEGENADNSTGAILERFRQQVADAQRFGEQLRTLTTMGLNQTSLRQILDAGAKDGGVIAQSLLAGGPGAISQINGMAASLEQTSNALGNSVAGAMYDAGIKAAEGLVKGLQAQKTAIEAAITTIAKGMVTGIKAALGIKSPSRVFMGIGNYTAQGLAEGIDAGSPVVQSAMDRMAAIRPGPGEFSGASAGAASRGGMTVNVTVQGSVTAERDLARSIAGEVKSQMKRESGWGK